MVKCVADESGRLLFAPSQEIIQHGIEALGVIDKEGVARVLEEFQS